VLQPRLRFPRFTIADMVESQCRLVAHLAIDRLHAIVGASMGGMQALQWAVSHPRAMRKVVALAPLAKTPAWSAAVNETSRRALMADPAWPDDVPHAGWATWTALMRVIAGSTPDKLAATEPGDGALSRQLDRLTAQTAAAAFDAVDWVYQTWAYDDHDVGIGHGGDWRRALATVEAETLIMAPPLDLYNPSAAARAAADHITGARFVGVPTVEGHQCTTGRNISDTLFINAAMREFLWIDP